MERGRSHPSSQGTRLAAGHPSQRRRRIGHPRSNPTPESKPDTVKPLIDPHQNQARPGAHKPPATMPAATNHPSQELRASRQSRSRDHESPFTRSQGTSHRTSILRLTRAFERSTNERSRGTCAGRSATRWRGCCRKAWRKGRRGGLARIFSTKCIARWRRTGRFPSKWAGVGVARPAIWRGRAAARGCAAGGAREAAGAQRGAARDRRVDQFGAGHGAHRRRRGKRLRLRAWILRRRADRSIRCRCAQMSPREVNYASMSDDEILGDLVDCAVSACPVFALCDCSFELQNLTG